MKQMEKLISNLCFSYPPSSTLLFFHSMCCSYWARAIPRPFVLQLIFFISISCVYQFAFNDKSMQVVCKTGSMLQWMWLMQPIWQHDFMVLKGSKVYRMDEQTIENALIHSVSENFRYRIDRFRTMR